MGDLLSPWLLTSYKSWDDPPGRVRIGKFSGSQDGRMYTWWKEPMILMSPQDLVLWDPFQMAEVAYKCPK